jgi:hypothetical protein
LVSECGDLGPESADLVVRSVELLTNRVVRRPLRGGDRNDRRVVAETIDLGEKVGLLVDPAA